MRKTVLKSAVCALTLLGLAQVATADQDADLVVAVDQLGQLRINPDIGASEAVTGSISGKVVVATNQDNYDVTKQITGDNLKAAFKDVNIFDMNLYLYLYLL